MDVSTGCDSDAVFVAEDGAGVVCIVMQYGVLTSGNAGVV